MLPRHLTPRIVGALKDTPAVFLEGARQTGKSTLTQAIARDCGFADYVTSTRPRSWRRPKATPRALSPAWRDLS